MVVSRVVEVREEKRGKIQEILRKLELLDLVHPGSGLGNWIVGAATHQGRETSEELSSDMCVQCGEN